MRTGVNTLSKNQKKLSTVAAVTGSAVVIALAAAFVTVDFSGFMITPSFTVDENAIEALEPIRSDPVSEQSDNGEKGNNGGGGDKNDGNNSNNIVYNNDNEEDNDSTSDDDSGYPDHELPCLDPNCPIHHGNNTGHQYPCDDPNCEICYGHDLPCNDPNCLIHNGHGLPCDDPNCPIHGGRSNEDEPPVEISMEIVRFKPNSAEYVDTDEATTLLAEYIESFDRYFERYPDSKIYLAGCIAKTASWSITETELSLERAETVRQSLIDLGVDGNRLVAIGIGINDPWRSDEWADGYFNENVAKLNRRVWIVPDQYTDLVNTVLEIDKEIDSLKAYDAQ